MKHTDPHPLCGETVVVTSGLFQGQSMYVLDWWDRFTGQSWMTFVASPACFDYALRTAVERAPVNNEAVLGLIGSVSKIVHASQLPVAGASHLAARSITQTNKLPGSPG